MRLNLTIACGYYDRSAPLMDGTVRPDGIDVNFLPMEAGELFRRQARHAEFDVSEFSTGTYTLLLARGDRRFVAIPVFPSRMFRHAYIWINTRAGIREPKDLIGKRFGTMEYQQTAAVWQRGMLKHDYGVGADQVTWYFGGYDEPEHYTERVPVKLPANLRIERLSEQQTLSQMLADGEIDALMGARPPRAFLEGAPTIAPLFPNAREVELEYYRRTGIYPIMHLVVIKREIYEAHPWVAVSMYKALLEAQRVGWQRLHLGNAIFAQMPWLHQQLAEQQALLGKNIFTYTLEENREVLATFLQYMQEDGLLERPLTVEELFVPETHERPAGH
jgi:4,5-dihydroxyphthalate decarboxylase